MFKFKLTCPDCGAVIVTRLPQAMVWELCPSCKKHIWDRNDILMADIYASPLIRTGNSHVDN